MKKLFLITGMLLCVNLCIQAQENTIGQVITKIEFADFSLWRTITAYATVEGKDQEMSLVEDETKDSIVNGVKVKVYTFEIIANVSPQEVWFKNDNNEETDHFEYKKDEIYKNYITCNICFVNECQWKQVWVLPLNEDGKPVNIPDDGYLQMRLGDDNNYYIPFSSKAQEGEGNFGEDFWEIKRLLFCENIDDDDALKAKSQFTINEDINGYVFSYTHSASITFTLGSLDAFKSDGGEQTVKVTSNGDWKAEITEADSWIALSDSEGSGNNEEITVTVEPNASIIPRNGCITFTVGEKTFVLEVSQEGAEPSITFAPEGQQVFTAEGGEQEITVSSNAEWKAEIAEADSWITLSDSVGSGNNEEITVTVEPNTSIIPRNGCITFTMGEKTFALEVSQEGAEPSITFAPESLDTFKSDGGEQRVNVTSNGDWKAEITEADSWIALSDSEGSGNNEEITVTVEPNASIIPRNGCITFTVGEKTFVLEVSQEGAEPNITFTPESLDTFKSDGGEQTVKLTSNADWNVKSCSPWIKLDKENGEKGTSVIIITIQENKHITERGGNIIFTINDTEFKLHVIQLCNHEVADVNWVNSALIDKSNIGNKLNETMSIRSGNTIKVSNPIMIPEEPNNKWTYIWEIGDKSIGSEMMESEITIPSSNTPKEYVLTCRAILSNGGNTIWERLIYEKSIFIYPKPTVQNLKYRRKGDGSSNTWIINKNCKLNDKETLIIGSDNGRIKEITSSEISKGWFQLYESFKEKDVFIYVVHDYGNNVRITSDKYKTTGDFAKECDSTPWDGSSYDDKSNMFTRGSSETTSIDNHETMRGKSVKEVYTINGAKTATMTRGLNIIRMEDGTVRKVFKK